jgi:3-oxoacyl-[acyl-carrier protein] reductase
MARPLCAWKRSSAAALQPVCHRLPCRPCLPDLVNSYQGALLVIIDLTGLVVIVTGAGRGIGAAICQRFAAEGAKVTGWDVSPDDLALTGRAIFAAGGIWRGREVDVRDYGQVSAAVAGVLQEFGRIDVVVNNAGVGADKPLDVLTEEEWDRCFDVNLKGVWQVCKAVVPAMKRQRAGRIINAASFAAIIPMAGVGAYAASKSGVVQLTRALAGELGPWDVTVNAYAPGMVPTDINHFTERTPEEQERLLSTLTLRHWGSKADIADLCCFLASDKAGYITGTLIDVSGGKLATQQPAAPYAWAGSAQPS